MFLHEAKRIPRKFLLLRPRSPDSSKVFLSNNYVQTLSSVHSNVQLSYLPLSFAVGVGVADLIAGSNLYFFVVSSVPFL